MDTGAFEEANVRPGYFCLARTNIHLCDCTFNAFKLDSVLFSTIKKDIKSCDYLSKAGSKRGKETMKSSKKIGF